MVTTYEISNIANRTVSARSAIANKNTDYQSAAAVTNWKGDIATSFKNANSRAKTKMNSLLSTYNALNTKLTNLSSAVQRAETKRQLSAK